MALYKSQDTIFVFSAVIFNILVSIVYISTKFDFISLLKNSGIIFVSLIIPFAFTLRGYLNMKAESKIIISNILVLFYLFLELLLDYVLKIPFREILSIHVFYIIFFYAAEFSLMSVAFSINRKAGFVVAFTFCVLIGCLAYLYLG